VDGIIEPFFNLDFLAVKGAVVFEPLEHSIKQTKMFFSI